MIKWDLDWREPLDAFAPLAGVAGAHLFHGGALSRTAEWSIIAAFPAATLVAEKAGPDPFPALDDARRDRHAPRDDALKGLPFVSGALGFIGYEAAQYLEAALDLLPSPFALPDMSLGLYDAAALFSRSRRQALVVGRNKAACRRLRDALGREGMQHQQVPEFGPVASNFTQQRYLAAVAEARENILNGEYYQANLSHQLTCEALAPFQPFDLFARLSAQSDAFHGALLQFDNGAILSNSPERFFRIEPAATGDRIIAEPIKGTRRRGAGAIDDAALARELLADPKDRAENIMIADLLRNDLSKICCDGSIREEAICALMSLANVHHLVSRISGVLRRGVRPAEIFAALFPCGSITGAPKIAAMEAIARIENVGRGPYCGAIGYFDDRGGADFAVSIRTLMIEDRKVTIPVGGGVTLRSNPADEYEETIIKARGALMALGDPQFTGGRP